MSKIFLAHIILFLLLFIPSTVTECEFRAPDTLTEMHSETFPYEHTIKKMALKHGVNPELVVAIIQQESKFHSSARSKKGAVGLMQLMPNTARYLNVNPHDVEQNIEGGIRYLVKQLKKYKCVKLALAAYNSGPGNVDKYGKTVPPFKQTQTYVKNICQTYKQCEHFSSSIILG